MNLIKNKKNTGRAPIIDARLAMKQNQSNEMLPNFDDEPIYGLGNNVNVAKMLSHRGPINNWVFSELLYPESSIDTTTKLN